MQHLPAASAFFGGWKEHHTSTIPPPFQKHKGNDSTADKMQLEFFRVQALSLYTPEI